MTLSQTEYKVVSGLLSGQRPGDLADALGVRPCTVSNHLRIAEQKAPGLAGVVAFARALHKANRCHS